MSKQDLKYIIETITNNGVPKFSLGSKIRNASIVAILRWRPYHIDNINYTIPSSAMDFLNLPWVNDCHGEAEIMYIRRAVRLGDIWSGHIGFPGGKSESTDKSSYDTVFRECKEEIGLDLTGPEFISLGTLTHLVLRDDRIKFLMTIVPHIFVQVTPITPNISIRVAEVAETFWSPIRYLLQNPIAEYSPLSDVVLKPGEILPWLPEATQVAAVQLKTTNGKERPIWGMTLRITQKILGMPISSHALMSAEELEDLKNKAKL